MAVPFLRALALLLLVAGGARAAEISNTATLGWTAAGRMHTVRSNTVVLHPAARTRTAIRFSEPRGGTPAPGMRCGSTPEPWIAAAAVSAAALRAAAPVERHDPGMPLIVALDDAAGNRDAAQREVRTVTLATGGRAIAVTLAETGADTGTFAGRLPPLTDAVVPGCDLSLHAGRTVVVRFGGDRSSAPAAATLLIDPLGYVFDARTGAPVDGAQVTLVDAAGKPATVFGDDGTSRYPATVTSGAAVTDASGHGYPGVAGRYRFPLVPPGRYALRVVPPALYRAPSTLPPEVIARAPDPIGRAFVLNAASFGGALVLANDEPFTADIPLDRDDAGEDTVLLTHTASVREASPGDTVEYRVTYRNRSDAPIAAPVVRVALPPGLAYRRGLARGGGEPSGDGGVLTFAAKALPPGATGTLRYATRVAPGAPVGEAIARARLTVAGAAASNAALAAVRLRALLFTDALTVIGRIGDERCGTPPGRGNGVAGVRVLMEDGRFTVTDRDGLYHFEGVGPGRHVVQIDTATLPPGRPPIACADDSRSAGNAASRFVEGVGGVPIRADFHLAATSRAAAAAAPDPPPAFADDATAAGHRDWLAGLTPGIGWLFPAAGHNPRAPQQRVVVKHPAGTRVALLSDGAPVDHLSFDGSEGDGRGMLVSRWSGLPLHPGDTRFTARVVDARSAAVATIERIVHYGGAAASATVDAAHSRLVADGAARPLVALCIVDAGGSPVRHGTTVPVRIDTPFALATDPASPAPRTIARVEGDDGLALVALQPTTQAGAVRLHLTFAEARQVREQDVRAWLVPAAREWTVVGFGAGSIGHDILTRHARALPRSARDGVADGALALYAKGRIKGEWLLTIAYDGDRRADPDRALLGTIDPGRYYTVYGDGSAQGFDAATRRKLYLRLERREAYALWGDFETGLTDARLTRYSRTLTGAKAAFEGRGLRASGFVAEVATRYARDDIAGNGLSGPYRLSARDIVPGSDKVAIEVRDRLRPDCIVAQTAMTRHLDYDIDPVAGTLRFRQPVLGRDARANPQYIVVDYETGRGRSGQVAAAGRVAARIGAAEIGVAAIRDDAAGRAGVVGADLHARIAPGTDVRGELAAGGRGGIGHGRAYLAEVEHHRGGVDLLLYAREQDRAFGVGQQNLVEAGTRRIGIDARAAINGSLSIVGSGWHAQRLGAFGTRAAGDVRVERRGDTGTLFVGGQVARDTDANGTRRDSRLLTLGGTRALFGGAVTLSGQTQVAPGGDRASADFPIRHQLDLGWRIVPDVRLLAGYEIADGAAFAARTARVGFEVAPWHGGKWTSTLARRAPGGENAARLFAQYGLSQSLPIGRHWRIDATLDAADTVRGARPTGASASPVAAGGIVGDYRAVTAGASYRDGPWLWTSRVERRGGDDGRRWGWTSALTRTLGGGRTLALAVNSVRNRAGPDAVSSLTLGDAAIAWRPPVSRWSVLERWSLRHARAGGPPGAADPLGVAPDIPGGGETTRVSHHLALTYRRPATAGARGIEIGLYHGVQYLRARSAGAAGGGVIDVLGGEGRVDLSPRLDCGITGSVQHAWRDNAWAWSGGPSVGLSPARDLWISAGYNLSGYRDQDAAGDRYTRAGPYLTARVKFDAPALGDLGRRIAAVRL